VTPTHILDDLLADPPFVVKLGTGVVTQPGTGLVDRDQIDGLAEQVAEARKAGKRVVIVSSGAVGAGLEALGLDSRPTEVPLLQACAAVGQTRLMKMYDECFQTRGLRAAQLLLTRANLANEKPRSRVLATLSALLSHQNIVPVINENDSVAIEELAFGDNDVLGAQVAILMHSPLFVILTGVRGLLDNRSSESTLIPKVEDIDEVLPLVGAEKGKLSVGGMASKLKAIGQAVEAGVPAMIAEGRNLPQLNEILAGGGIGTRFPVSGSTSPP